MSKSTERFMAAGVPRSCWELSCRDRGQVNITEWAKEQARRRKEREALVSAYVLHPVTKRGAERRAEDFTYCQETVDLLARQAVLEGLPVKVVPFHGLVHALQHPSAYISQDTDPEARARTTIFDLLGQGVIVVPLLPNPLDAECEPYQYRVALDFLLTHLYEGGALVIGGSEQLSKRLQSGYPDSLERLLLGNSEYFGTGS